MIEKNEYFSCFVKKNNLTVFITNNCTTGVFLHDLIYFVPKSCACV